MLGGSLLLLLLLPASASHADRTATDLRCGAACKQAGPPPTTRTEPAALAWTPLPLSGAALNSLGLPSKGVDAALANIAAFRERHGVRPQRAERARGAKAGDAAAVAFPIGVSIMGHPAHGSDPAKKLEGVVQCVRRAIPHADFIEINESCPNVHHGGGGTDDLRKRLEAIVAVRDQAAKATGRRVPILVKLGDLGDAKGTVRFLSRLGVDGVVALNTQKDYAAFELPDADRALLQHFTQSYGGGLSGPPILARSTEQVGAACSAVKELRLARAGCLRRSRSRAQPPTNRALSAPWC